MLDYLTILRMHYSQNLGKIQVLILDDFLITHINEERASILFQLIKLREVCGTSTVVTCQYSCR